MKSNNSLVPIMNFGQKLIYNLLVLIWFGTLIWFWNWWLSPTHFTNWIGIFITSFVAAYQTIIPLWFFWFAGKAVRPNPNLPPPAGRVAMMTTKTPSEPWDMVERTLVAMLCQEYSTPFDVWLADEDPSPQTIAWCRQHRVGLVSRKGIPDFNRASYPGQTKTKEGNTLFWYATVGYKSYDFVVQMDVDHAPMDQYYLQHMIAPFVDPKVGLVAAPSLNDHNTDESWAVRGRYHTEATFHGLMQAGYASYGAAMGIGSHYAVRTKALQEAGGPGPTRAEDASTTLFINAAGYDSVFAFDAWASGDGPGSFGSLASQEIQWSSSLMRILIEWTPQFWSKLNTAKKIIFGFSQSWYPSYGSHLLIGSFLPVLAIIFNTPWMQMNYLDFLFHWWVLIATCILPIAFVKSQGFFKPQDAPLISWEGILFQITRWPWVVIGCFQGVLESLTHANYTFKVTPKGKDKERPLGFGVLAPYLFLTTVSAITILFSRVSASSNGYRWLALLDVTLYTTAIFAIITRHNQENRHKMSWGTRFANNTAMTMGLGILLATTLATYTIISTTIAQGHEKNQYTNSEYVGVRTQIGPTPTPTLAPAPIEPIIEIFVAPTATTTPNTVVDLNTKIMINGMYNPSETFANTHFDTALYFTDWNDPQETDKAITDAQLKHEFPIITVQPYHKFGLVPTNVLSDIAAGLYDDEIISIAQVVAQHSPQVVMIRWGHEMEFCTLYDWSICAPTPYITAYRHVVDLTRAQGVTNILWMWSPVGGNPNTNQFYPGDTYVDYIGITGLVSESWDNFYGVTPAPQSLEHLLDQKYGVATEFQKPLIIAELGISYNDPNIDRTKWLTEAFKTINNKKKISFNCRLGILQWSH